MDHLPLPSNPTFGFLDVPFLCEEQYDGGPFLTYPVRNGWNVTQHEWPDKLSCRGREVEDEAEMISFLQTWLYLGLLFGITGNAVDPKIFRSLGRTSNEPRFSSEHLVDLVGKWSLEVATAIRNHDKELGRKSGGGTKPMRDAIDCWRDDCDNILSVAHAIWFRVFEVYESKSSRALNLVYLSIAALGDYLGQALVDIMRQRVIHGAVDTYKAQETRWQLPKEICEPILRNMKGWCPNRLNGFLDVLSPTVILLWYLANFKQPKVRDDHRMCTAGKCNSLHVDKHNYIMKHTSSTCHCTLIGPRSVGRMERIIDSGSIPLFTVQYGAEEAKVLIKDAAEVGGYIAISHVWADGFGNLEANSLPTCVLKRLQSSVNFLGILSPTAHTSMWMDTICLPRYPLALRRKAISGISEVFSRAIGILVLDSYLQSLDSSKMTHTELISRISMSGWTSRLWTLSEGYLAKRVWFQFRDKAIDYYNFMSQWEEELHYQLPSGRLPSNPLVDLSEEIRGSASDILGLVHQGSHEERRLKIGLGELKGLLNSRQTSWLSDEALCLGAILGIDLMSIVNAKDSKKMVALWQQMTIVPVYLIFIECSPKLKDTGYRWAPATILGGTNPGLGNLPAYHVKPPYAQPTKNGLEFTLNTDLPIRVMRSYPGAARKSTSSRRNFINFCRQVRVRAEGDMFLLQDKSGRWYRCLPMMPWHQIPIDPDFEHEFPMFFVSTKFRSVDTRDSGGLGECKGFVAIFATYIPSTKSSLLARCHTHYYIRECPEYQTPLLDELAQCALDFEALRQPRSDSDSRDQEDVEKTLAEIASWLRDRYTKEALEYFVTKIQDPAFGPEHFSIDTRLEICAVYIRYFCLVGKWYKVKWSDPEERTTWCVD